MKRKFFRLLRILTAGIVLGCCTAAVWGVLPLRRIYGIQFGPAFFRSFTSALPGAILAVMLILLVTFLFGRVYCSVLCPLGILQDVFLIFRRKFTVQPSYRGLRWSVFAFLVLTALTGIPVLLIALMPGSTFAVIAVNVFRVPIRTLTGSETLSPSLAAFLFAWGFFLLLLAASVWRGRIYCNTFCPVGTVLSLFSARARFGIRISDSCKGCGACEKVCKAGCIDFKNHQVNTANCVVCLNCLPVCRFQALSYGPVKKTEKKTFSPERRLFILSGAAAAAGAGAGLLLKRNSPPGKDEFGNTPAMPPGAGSYDRFSRKCIACGLCVSACREHVLTHAAFQYGFRGILQPYLKFSSGACSYTCTDCMDVCPCGALEKLPLPEKQRLKIGTSVYDRKNCISFKLEEDCGACAEHCPVGAISMTPWKKTTLPQVNTEICIGCGACENICPASPVPAIQVHGAAVQELVRKPEQSKEKKLESEDDFPF